MFSACSRSNASAAAHLAQEDAVRPETKRGPQQIADRHGRQARLLPPGFKRDQVRASSCISEVSSITTIRSSSGSMSSASAFSSVVFPVPVPPLIRMFCRLRMAVAEISSTLAGNGSDADQFLGGVELACANFRIVSVVPPMLHGGNDGRDTRTVRQP